MQGNESSSIISDTIPISFVICIVFEDEITEYNDYIKKHPLSRPIGTVNTVYLDKNTLSIVEEVQL